MPEVRTVRGRRAGVREGGSSHADPTLPCQPPPSPLSSGQAPLSPPPSKPQPLPCLGNQALESRGLPPRQDVQAQRWKTLKGPCFAR